MTKHACNLKVNNAEVVHKIPRDIKDVMLEIHIEKHSEFPETEPRDTSSIKYNTTYYVRRKELLEAINYLYEKNIWYTNKSAEVNIATLNNLEEHLEDNSSTIHDERIAVDEDGEVEDCETNKSILESIKEHLGTKETENNRGTYEKNNVFIRRTNEFATWRDTPNLVELAHPILFPDGKGGLYNYNVFKFAEKSELMSGNQSYKGVTYTGFFNHCLLFYTRQFQHDKNFIAWFRSKGNSQRTNWQRLYIQ